jgi:predicted cupin superfamily sugar epimerase
MDTRIRELIERLALEPHPEGGWYREIFRSARRVTLGTGGTRSALTTIHFLLARGTHSRWHRVAGEEIWHLEEGGPLELMWLTPDLGSIERRMMRADPGAEHVAVVPAGAWQAARPLGDYTLAGCTMGPGFEFEDFTLLANHPDASELQRRHPELAALI